MRGYSSIILNEQSHICMCKYQVHGRMFLVICLFLLGDVAFPQYIFIYAILNYICITHFCGTGGPTAEARGILNLNIQFWTSRGWAFVDVNYGGSTGMLSVLATYD